MNNIFDPENEELMSAELYKVGDIVVINPEIKITHKGRQVVSDMIQYAGKTAEITQVLGRANCYRIDIDKGCWNWQDFMFFNDLEPTDEQKVWSML